MPTTLNGTLRRVGPNQWQWSDGTAEPRVTDLSSSSVYNFRCRTYANATYVEILLSVAHKERDVLGWILDGVAVGKYRQDMSGDHTGPLMLTDDGPTRMRIEPGEDPLRGNEPIVHKRAIPRVALVPIAEWDAWAAENPYGASWDKGVEADIFAKARSLGWIG
jgi:hypothetical protein